MKSISAKSNSCSNMYHSGLDPRVEHYNFHIMFLEDIDRFGKLKKSSLDESHSFPAPIVFLSDEPPIVDVSNSKDTKWIFRETKNAWGIRDGLAQSV